MVSGAGRNCGSTRIAQISADQGDADSAYDREKLPGSWLREAGRRKSP